jgi:vacuolar iron transporter family protein
VAEREDEPVGNRCGYPADVTGTASARNVSGLVAATTIEICATVATVDSKAAATAGPSKRGSATAFAPMAAIIALLDTVVSIASLGFLALLGAVGAKAGGADIMRATARVTFWGALAMIATASTVRRRCSASL